METTKPVIYFIHGMWCGPWVWENYLNFFTKQGFEYFNEPLIYHGKDRGNHEKLGKTSVATYAETTAEKIKKIGRPCVVIGHSMGALIAPLAAQRIHSLGLVKSMVLINPALPGGIIGINFELVINGFKSIIFSPKLFGRQAVKQSFEEAQWSFFNCLPENQHWPIYKKLGYESSQAILEIGFWLVWPKWHKAIEVDVKKINMPILVVAGQEDRITPAVNSLKAASYYNEAGFYSYEGHAHWIISEPGWEKVAQEISTWIKALTT